MSDKDLIEFFIYLRDHCYNRDFQIAPEKIVEQFHEYRQQEWSISTGLDVPTSNNSVNKMSYDDVMSPDILEYYKILHR